MVARSILFVCLFAGLLSGVARAKDDPDYENWLLRVGDYKTLYRSWRYDARMGDLDKQERVADLLLGPHGREVGVVLPYEGIHLLYGLAINGRRTSMLRLASALDKGAYGLKKRPDAARCWAEAPAGFQQRLACVAQTEFRDSKARFSCMDIMYTSGYRQLNARNAKPMVQLCLANKTPAILVPGLPPSRQDMARVDAFKRQGIDWSITGDVYEEEFEAFRDVFNETMIAAIDAQRGQGYFDRLAKDIDTCVAGKPVKTQARH